MSITKKSHSVFLAFVLYLIISLPFGMALSITQLEARPDITEVVISWTTDEAASGFVNYTTNNNAWDKQHPGFTTDHEVSITGLLPSTTYRYQVTSISSETTSEQSSSWRQFTTKPQADGALFFNPTSDIPEYSSGEAFTIEATTLVDAHVNVYINDLPTASAYANANGIVRISGNKISLGRETSTIRIVVDHPETDETLTNEYQITLDATAPNIDLDDIVSVSTTGSITISGTTDEKATLQIVSQDSDGNNTEFDKIEVEDDFSTTIHVDEGTHRLRLFFTDRAGHEITFSKTVVVDQEPPRILEHNLNELSPTYSSRVTVRGRVNEPLAEVRIYVNPDEDNLKVCHDGEDNDGDGLIDFLRDPGCDSIDDMSERDYTGNAECSDGIDNDEDGRIDFLRDKGCTSAGDDDESDDPTGENQCNDGRDNDGDGKVDFLNDAGCESGSDNSEDSDESENYVITTADEDGYFSEKITLTQLFSLNNIRLTEAMQVLAEQGGTGTATSGTTQNTAIGVAYDSQGNPNDQGNNLVRIVAIDKVGQRDSVQGYVRHATCGTSGDWNIMLGEVYPSIIQPDLLMEGVAQFSFDLDFSYGGGGNDPKITSISFIPREMSIEDTEDFDPRAVLDQCQVFPPSGIQSQAYVVCKLKRYPPIRGQNVTGAYDQLKDLKMLDFPLKMRVNYAYTDYNNQPSSKYQETCFDMSIALDKRISPDSIPEGLLNTTVNLLDKTIDVIDRVQKPLNTVTLAATAACLVSDVVQYFDAVSVESACFTLSKKEEAQIEQYLRGMPANAILTEELNNLYNELHPNEEDAQNTAGTLQSQAFIACGTALKGLIKNQHFSNQVCDRVYCPAVPTAQKYIADVNKQRETAQKSACDYTINIPGENGEGHAWYESASTPIGSTQEGSEFVKDEGCGKEYYDEWSSGCLAYSFSGNNDIVEASKNPGGSKGFARVLDNLQFCKAEEEVNGSAFRNGDITYMWKEGTGNNQGCYVLGNDPYYDYTEQSRNTQRNEVLVEETQTTISQYRFSTDAKPDDVSECLGNHDGQLYLRPIVDNEPVFFNPEGETDRKALMQGSTRHEGILVQLVEGTTYIGADNTLYTFHQTGDKSDQPYLDTYENYHYVYKNTKTGEFTVQKPDEANANVEDLRQARAPTRITESEYPDTLIDPAGSFLNSVRCVCLPAISGYLQKIRSILTSVRNCFEGVLVTKEFNSGMCKAVLTQYVCDWIFEAIGCVTKAAGRSAEDGGRSLSVGGTGVQGTLASLSGAGSRVKDYATGRYGNTGSFQALFTERKLLHSACLAAFGYDWLPEIDAAINIGGGGFAINSSAMVFPATRRFMSSNPIQQGVASFVYHIGYMVAAGDDVNYQVELICSNDNSCDPAEGFEGGRCDCYGGTTGVTPYPTTGANVYSTAASTVPAYGQVGATGMPPYQTSGRTYMVDGGYVEAGETSESGGKGEVYRMVTDSVRYDKVRVTWFPKSYDQGTPGQVIVPIKTIGARPPSYCIFDTLMLRYRCNMFIPEQGDVSFIGEPQLSPNKVYSENEEVKVIFRANILNPESGLASPKFALLTVRDHTGAVVGVPKMSNNIVGVPGSITFPDNGIKISFSGRVNLESNIGDLRGSLQSSTVTQSRSIVLSLVNNKCLVDGIENGCTYVDGVINTGQPYNIIYRVDPTVVSELNADTTKEKKTTLKFNLNGGQNPVCTDGQPLDWSAVISLHNGRPALAGQSNDLSGYAPDMTTTIDSRIIPLKVNCPGTTSGSSSSTTTGTRTDATTGSNNENSDMGNAVSEANVRRVLNGKRISINKDCIYRDNMRINTCVGGLKPETILLLTKIKDIFDANNIVANFEVTGGTETHYYDNNADLQPVHYSTGKHPEGLAFDLSYNEGIEHFVNDIKDYKPTTFKIIRGSKGDGHSTGNHFHVEVLNKEAVNNLQFTYTTQ